MQTPGNVRILARDVTGDGRWSEWTNPVRVLRAESARDVADVLEQVEDANRQNLHALGFVTYEAGAAFDDRLAVHQKSGSLPYAWFALFDTHVETELPTSTPSPLIKWSPSLERGDYRTKINTIKRHIAAGETYQVNFTLKLTASLMKDAGAETLFAGMYARQPTPYAMLIETEHFDVISLSPELFFEQCNGRVVCKPMKGTCPRAPHPRLDEASGRSLHESIKNRAENVMIVDMVRNDLARVPGARNVRVDHLFEVTPWPTLWQMTSTVSAESDAGVAGIFAALFPSASITGAPKLKTSEIIRELESEPRGVYTGAIGWSAPGSRSRFAVAIRTAVLDRTTKTAEYGIGSGIVWDSDADGEYDECLLKARLMAAEEKEFQLLETIRWDRADGFRFLDRHMKRLEVAADQFGFEIDTGPVLNVLKAKADGLTWKHARFRLLVDRRGEPTLEVTELTGPANYEEPSDALTYRARIDSERHSTASPFLYHKTTNRNIYDDARARSPDTDEVLLINDRDEVMEFSTGNLVARINGRLITPALESGLLPGVLRDELIDSGRIAEAVIGIEELKRADGLYFINSVRGWVRVRLV